ncbi:MAG TPA: hypothetical protein VFI12_03480 [Thermomicrobiales bacterium]|nr:hypothetical protein [Thermomicrobiales bacterium]
MKTLLLALALTIAPLIPASASSDPFIVSVIGRGRPMILIPGLSSGPETWTTTFDPSAVADAMGEMFGVNLEPAPARITAPTLVLAAWQSYAQYTNHDRHMATLRQQFTNLHGVQLQLNDTAHHFIMWDDPRWLFEQMDRFLATR